jgi:tripartite-type tricarboxylate transporter receptor subunit TctC
MLSRSLLALVVAPLISAAAFAQEWPTKHVSAIVPLGAGSAVDIVARTVLDQVAVQLGQPVLIENRPGAGNTLGMGVVARAKPDGYTVLVNSSSHSLVPITYTSLPFDTFQDLVPIAPLGSMPTVMVVSPSKGYKDVAQFVAVAKSKQGGMNYSSAGVASFTHFAMEAFRLAAGFEATHIPFKGAAEALNEVLAERVDFYFAPLSAALPLIKDGKLQALAIAGSQRASALPNIPTAREAGYPKAEYNFWVGLFARANTPAPILDKLYRETVKALQSATVKERFVKLGIEPMAMDQAAFRKLINDEFELNRALAKTVGVKAN